MKDGVRASRGVAPTQIIKGNTKIRNWKTFLKNSTNKQSLFVALTEFATTIELSPGQQLVVTCRDQVLTNPPSPEIIEFLSPCNHEEADTRMILHVIDVLTFSSSALIRTVDTDVLVLAVATAAKNNERNVYVSFGVGSSHQIIDATAIATALGYEKSVALPVFHAFTGCDTVSSLKSIGKKTAWQRWNAFADVTEAFTDISTSPDSIDPQTMKVLERFVVLLYDRTSPCVSVNELRKELFTKGRSIEHIPPTSGALLQHANRTLHQGGHVWGKSDSKLMDLADPPPGWLKINGKYEPLWTLDDIASAACRQLVKCKCKGKDGVYLCKGRCSCRKINEACTDLCDCKGKCQWTGVERKQTSFEELEELEEEDEEEEDDTIDSGEEEKETESDLLFDTLLEI